MGSLTDESDYAWPWTSFLFLTGRTPVLSSFTSTEIGFSSKMRIPCSIAWMATAAWVEVIVEITTAAMLGEEKIESKMK